MKQLTLILIYLLTVSPALSTTCAWDGKTLATDSQMTKGHSRIMCSNKFVRSDARHAVLAGAGDVRTLDKIKKFFLENTRPISELKLGVINDPDMPLPFKRGADFAILIIPDSGSALYYEGELKDPVVIEAPFAFGTGEEYAMAAMAQGQTASQAIEVAEKLDIYTGGPIHTIQAPQVSQAPEKAVKKPVSKKK